MVSYDVVYRFTKIHVPESLDLIFKMVDVGTLKLLENPFHLLYLFSKGTNLRHIYGVFLIQYSVKYVLKMKNEVSKAIISFLENILEIQVYVRDSLGN